MFISEMSETSIRGALASLMQLMATFGLLFVDALNINGVVHWNYISAICISIPGIVLYLNNVAGGWNYDLHCQNA